MRFGKLPALCLATTLAGATAFDAAAVADACSRLLYETGDGSYIIARSMDWNDPMAATSLWVFPQGMQRDGGIGDNPLTWTSKHGSVITSFYDAASVDGINDKGLMGNVLYLAESDYGDAVKIGKPTISIGAWLQYFLDNYATVKEAVAAMQDSPFTVVAPVLPNGRPASGHLSLADSSGDSAIFEYLDGKLVIHHGPEYRVMTNSPTFDQQLALDSYWQLIGGDKFLPGTISAADRFARLSYNLQASPKFKDPQLALASAFSQIRAMSVPIGMSDPDHPNISSTLWRTVADDEAKRYFFESAVFPAVFWVDLENVDLGPGASPMRLEVDPEKPMAGEVSANFQKTEPFAWLK
ncbi:MAG: linear amide C-N hydrolase [Methyloceanibacter sp.]|jgi:choloylglycine hydrolase